jgi:hypothetical protein
MFDLVVGGVLQSPQQDADATNAWSYVQHMQLLPLSAMVPQVPPELQKDTQQQMKEALAKLQELYMGQTAAEDAEADAAEAAAAAGSNTAGRAGTAAAGSSSAGAS